MIILDTHLWIWWVRGDKRLSRRALASLDRQADSGIGVGTISCREVSMLYILKRLILPCSLDEWLDQALRYRGLQLIELTRPHLLESCRSPGEFHKDPADRMIVAAARGLSCPLVTAD